MKKLSDLLHAGLLCGLLLCACQSCEEAVETPTPSPLELATCPEGFSLLTDSVPDAILEIRYFSTYNFVGQRIDGYNAPRAYLTCPAASALRQVNDELRTKGYCLKIYDTYRPQRAVDHFVRWASDKDDTTMRYAFYPEIAKDRIIPEGYVATQSSHTRGSTVDLTLVDMRSGRELDMGCPFDYFGQPSHPDYQGITSTQKANRMLLREAMLRHGFNPIPNEWWHFTLRNEPFPDTYFNFPIL